MKVNKFLPLLHISFVFAYSDFKNGRRFRDREMEPFREKFGDDMKLVKLQRVIFWNLYCGANWLELFTLMNGLHFKFYKLFLMNYKI